MRRQDLEYVIAEVGRRTGLDYFYIIGSAAVLASLPASQDPALVGTRDVDIIPSPEDPTRQQEYADRLDVLFGEMSDFDDEHGFYVQGVDSTTPTYAPAGWMERAIPVRAENVTALCMELHDLALSKYGAGREKDFAFTAALAKTGIVNKATLESRLQEVQGQPEVIALVRARIGRDFSTGLEEGPPVGSVGRQAEINGR